MSIRAGDLNNRIIIQENKLIEDEVTGIETKKWITVCTPFAKVLDIGGAEFFSSANENTKIRTKFTIRYRDNIDEDMRILFINKCYNIVFVDNFDYNKQWLNLICELVK